mmetsp:Transcript_16880/g.31975  ORF Transcript_16880/g.31975 Transcript_16880/m.31975 type:complete len:927 (-) Transcript_16880:73-2853(-)
MTKINSSDEDLSGHYDEAPASFSATASGQGSRKHAHWIDDMNPIDWRLQDDSDHGDDIPNQNRDRDRDRIGRSGSNSSNSNNGGGPSSSDAQFHGHLNPLHFMGAGGGTSSTSTATTTTVATITTTTTTTAAAIAFDNHQRQHVPPTITTSEPSFSTDTWAGQLLIQLSRIFNRRQDHQDSRRSPATFAGFLSLLLLTMSNYMLGPMRDAAALKVGVSYIPTLTLVSTILALASSVPVGWLFEAPNPERKGRRWRGRIGLTRGETQGTSLALFLRCFAVCLFGYAFSFKLMDLMRLGVGSDGIGSSGASGASSSNDGVGHLNQEDDVPPAFLMDELSHLLVWNHGNGETLITYVMKIVSFVMAKFGKAFYVMFFLVVHLMKLHSISLMWGVTSEAMEYEEQAEIRARKRERQQQFGMMGMGMGIVGGSHGAVMDMEGEKGSSGGDQPGNVGSSKVGGKSRARLKRLAFVGFGGTLGGILGSVFVSVAAHKLHLSGLLIVASILLLLSAELSIELGQIMLRHWQEEQMELRSQEDLTLLVQCPTSPTDKVSESITTSSSPLDTHYESNNTVDSSLKRVTSIGGGMKRVASGMSMCSINSSSCEVDSSLKKVASLGSMKRVASGNSISNIRRAMSSGNSLNALGHSEPPKQIGNATTVANNVQSQPSQMNNDKQNIQNDQTLTLEDETTFKKRLLRGVTTILRSRLLMTIFTYNALYATTTVLLSFQRAELVANRSSRNSVDSDTAFLANINIASSVAVFALQASGLGAYIANSFGLRGTLSLMPMVRLFGVGALALWHVKANGEPPNLVLFLVLDEFTKVINFAVAKPVRENLWRGLSNEARYEAKPIVDTLANRWGGGSAAFLMSLFDRIMKYTGLGEELEDGTKSLFGFPPLLILCSISAVWWAMVSADLGQIRQRIDMELKKNE